MLLHFSARARYVPCAAVTMIERALWEKRQINMEYFIEDKFFDNLLHINTLLPIYFFGYFGGFLRDKISLRILIAYF